VKYEKTNDIGSITREKGTVGTQRKTARTLAEQERVTAALEKELWKSEREAKTTLVSVASGSFDGPKRGCPW